MKLPSQACDLAEWSFDFADSPKALPTRCLMFADSSLHQALPTHSKLCRLDASLLPTRSSVAESIIADSKCYVCRLNSPHCRVVPAPSLADSKPSLPIQEAIFDDSALYPFNTSFRLYSIDV